LPHRQAQIVLEGWLRMISNRNKQAGVWRSVFASVLLVCLVVLLCSGAPAALAQDVKGSVRGTVTDAQGAAVTDAEVTVSDPSTGFSRTTNTASDGVYNFPDLPLGRVMRLIKGRISHQLLEAAPELRADMGDHLWQEGYDWVEVTSHQQCVNAVRYVRDNRRRGGLEE